MENKAQKIAEFYVLTSRLKNLIRTGWQQWGIAAPRLESVAEHVYGTQMLAIAVWSELDYDVDLSKVIMMLAVHELGEVAIGDITPLDQVSDNQKQQDELAAVEKILSGLSQPEKFKNLFKEFEEQKTAEAKFAKQINKLEANLQVKLYDQAGYCDKDRPRTGFIEKIRQEYIVEKNVESFFDAWVDYDVEHSSYDEKFLRIIEWFRNNELREP